MSECSCYLAYSVLTAVSYFVVFFFCFFFFNDTATTEIYTLSLHDALPISCLGWPIECTLTGTPFSSRCTRSEEHTSELQSRSDLVCRLLLEKKKTKKYDLLSAKVSAVSECFRAKSSDAFFF